MANLLGNLFVGLSSSIPGASTVSPAISQGINQAQNATIQGTESALSAIGDQIVNHPIDSILAGVSGITGVGPSASTIAANQKSGGNLVSQIFLRGTIIILGFIFTAVGLSMFKPVQVVYGAK